MKKTILMLSIVMMLLFTSINALPDYILRSNLTFEGDNISNYNVSVEQWFIETSGCKSGDNCLRYITSDERYGDYAYIQNETFYTDELTSSYIRGWVNPCYTGGNEYSGFFSYFISGGTGQPPTETNYSEIGLNAGDNTISLVNILTGTLNNTEIGYDECNWYWFTYNSTLGNRQAFLWEDDTETTLIFGNTNIPDTSGNKGYMGFSTIATAYWDNIEFYTNGTLEFLCENNMTYEYGSWNQLNCINNTYYNESQYYNYFDNNFCGNVSNTTGYNYRDNTTSCYVSPPIVQDNSIVNFFYLVAVMLLGVLFLMYRLFVLRTGTLSITQFIVESVVVVIGVIIVKSLLGV